MMEEVELLDLKSLVLDDEEKWLYCMPNTCKSKKGACSISTWVRDEFEYSTSVSSPARKHLRHQLEEVVRNGRVKTHRVSLASSLNAVLSNNFTNDRSLADMPIDTRTFTRPKKSSACEPKLSRVADMMSVDSNVQSSSAKEKRSLQETPPTNGSHESDFADVSPQIYMRPGSERAKRSLFTIPNRDNLQADHCGGDNVDRVCQNGRDAVMDYSNGHNCGTLDGNSSIKLGGSCRQLSEVSDVQIIARVQEESLRKQCLTSALSMRHRTDADGKLKQRSLPNLSNDNKLSLSAGNDLDNVDAIEEQNGSNSCYSPSLPSNGSSPRALSPIDDTAKSRVDGNNGTRCDSPTLTPQKSGIPLARSCLPRPSSSKLPAPSRGSQNPASQVRRNPLDVSWREGCY